MPIDKTDKLLTKKEVPSLEEMMDEQGGFGKLQWFAYINCVMALNSAGFLYYNLAYLLLYPEFICHERDSQGSWVILADGPAKDEKCKPNNFC